MSDDKIPGLRPARLKYMDRSYALDLDERQAFRGEPVFTETDVERLLSGMELARMELDSALMFYETGKAKSVRICIERARKAIEVP